MHPMSLVVDEIEEYIVKTQMGFKMEPISIEQLNKWKVMFLTELNKARLAGLMTQGVRSPIRPILGEYIDHADSKKT